MYFDKLQNAISSFKTVFNIVPTVFIPPSNQLSDNALKAIQTFNLNISGLYGKNHLSIYKNFLRLYYYKFYKIHYPHVYKNITNQLSYHSLTTASSFDDLILKLEISNKLNAPFQIATHYWELDYNLLSQLNEICNYAKRIGYIPVKLSQILLK
jgi:predicted deacetylase